MNTAHEPSLTTGNVNREANGGDAAPPLFVTSMLNAPERICHWEGVRTFEDFSVKTLVAPDGRHAIRIAVEGSHTLWALTARPPQAITGVDFVTPFARTVCCGPVGFLQLRGEPGAQQWYRLCNGQAEPILLPGHVTPVCSADGRAVLCWEMSPVFRTDHPGTDLWIGNFSEQRHLVLAGPVMGACFTPDADRAYILVRQPSGTSTLLSVEIPTAAITELMRDLDTPPYPPGSVSMAATATHVYFPAVSTQAPDDSERQKPVAARWLKLYRYALATRQVELLAHSAADLADLAIANDHLYWVRSLVEKSVAVVPITGGTARDIAEAGMIPEWSPDGQRIAFTVGQFRLADWGINLDSHVISVNQQAQRVTEPSVLVDGAHEDFTATWSPDGKWIAYHSHRPTTPTTPYYDAPGVTDAIFVRRAEELDAPELRMSEQGWEIFQPRWSPDGRTILYSSWDRHGHPGFYSLFAVTFDPDTGKKVGVRKMIMPDGLMSPCWAAWSPDGQQIAIEDANGFDTRALWIIAADGGSGRKLHDYHAETFGGVDWTLDGKTLIYSALDGGRMALFAFNLTTSQTRKLSNAPDNLLHPRVSPDGRWIACSRIRTTQELWRARICAGR